MEHKRVMAVSLLLLAGCASLPGTSKYQVRGTERIKNYQPMTLAMFVGRTPEHRARQMTLEHTSAEYFDDFTLGVIEIRRQGRRHTELP